MCLIVILFIAQYPMAKGEDNLSHMKILPNKCVVSKAGESCISQMDFYVELVQSGKFCAYRMGEYISLFCFETFDEKVPIQIQMELEVAKDTKFVLVNEQLKTVVAGAEFYLLVYKPIEINKRPKRIWGIL